MKIKPFKTFQAKNTAFCCIFLLIYCFFSQFFLSLGQESPKSSDFYFVQLTDTHFDGSKHNRRVEAIANAVNALPRKIECVVITGDIMADNIEKSAIAESAIQSLAKFAAPLYLVPGNHDILSNKIDVTYPLYKKYFGEIAHKKEIKGVIFLFVYTEPLRKNFEIPGYEPLKWVEEELKNANGKPVIVFHHAPSSEDFYNNAPHESWPQSAREKWVKLINSANVKAVIAGHFHRDELHWLGNVPLFVSPPVASYWGRQATYRIYHYIDGKLEYTTQYVEMPHPPASDDK